MKTFEEFLTEDQVNIAQYQANTGKKPSGAGKWFFSKYKSYNPDEHSEEDLFTFTGQYSDAKKAAIKAFKAKGFTGTIYTQS